MPEENGHGAGSESPSQPVSLDAPQYQIAALHPRRAEAAVVIAFFVSVASFIGFGAAFWQNASNEWLGGTLGLGMAAFGYAMVAWGKYLMPRGPFEEPRALMEVTEEERTQLIGDFSSRGKVAIHRRSFLLKAMGAAAGVFGVVAAFPLIRSLGPLPKKSLYSTTWRKGSYLTTVDGRRMQSSDLGIGAIVTVFPQNDLGGALSQTVLIRLQDTAVTTKPGRETWGPDGYVAFSKVCTHAGCPVGLYQKLTEQLLCPCHQSLFDVREGCQPVFGPAPRPLAQLPLYVDASGFIRAQAPYDEPIGPGFWERGGTT